MEAPASAYAAPIHAAQPLRRWALRTGVVLVFAAGAWLFGTFTAAAETPDASPPGSAGGLLDAVHDNARDLVSFTAADNHDDAAAGATASPPAATGAGRNTIELPPFRLVVSETRIDSAAPAGLATDRLPTTPSTRAVSEEASPTAEGGAEAAHQPARVDDAVTVSASVHITGIRVAVESPIDAAATSQVAGADLSILPTRSLTEPVAIRLALGSIGAAVTLTSGTELLASMTDTLAVTLTEAAATVDPADGGLVARLALPSLPSAGGVQVLRGASAPVGSAAAKDVDSRRDGSVPTQFLAARTGVHGVIGGGAGAGPVPPAERARPAAVSAEVSDSPADPRRDRPSRSPAPLVVTTTGAGAELATGGDNNPAAWAASSDVPRPDRAVTVPASDRPAAFDHASDPGFSPD